jgi:hypothetical protein
MVFYDMFSCSSRMHPVATTRLTLIMWAAPDV